MKTIKKTLALLLILALVLTLPVLAEGNRRPIRMYRAMPGLPGRWNTAPPRA